MQQILIATGNTIPRFPERISSKLKNMNFYDDDDYGSRSGL